MTAPFEAYERELVEQMTLLGQRIKQAREFRRLTLHSLARQAGIGLQTLIRIEDGSINVAVLNLHKVLRVLGLPVDWLPQALPAPQVTPRTTLPLEGKTVDAALKDAARAASAQLASALGSAAAKGLNAEFERELRARMAAMLAGQWVSEAGDRPTAVVQADAQVGGPLSVDEPDCIGWVLKLRGVPRVLQGGREVEMGAPTELTPYADRPAALTALRRFTDKSGWPSAPVDALPLFKDGRIPGADWR
jgi:transcriptional regulator with XRE-family HTH domain